MCKKKWSKITKIKFVPKKLLVINTFLLLSLTVLPVHASWNGNWYQPGETLDPECVPGDVDCGIDISAFKNNSPVEFSIDNNSWFVAKEDGDGNKYIVPASSKISLGSLAEPFKEIFVSADSVLVDGTRLSNADGLLKWGGHAFTMTPTALNSAEIRLGELSGNGLNYVSLKAPSAITSNLTLTLPATAGTSGQALTTNGSGVLSWSTPAPSGITSLNGLTAISQTFVTGSAGTDFNIASSGSAHTFNIPSASATARGLVTTNTQIFAGDKTFANNLLVNGNVGIGTTNPSYHLELAGTDSIAARTIGVNGIPIAYLPDQSSFYGSLGIGNGLRSLSHSTGYQGQYNTAVGINALLSATTGHNNTALGSSSLYSNTAGYDNTALGVFSLSINTTGYDNVAVGQDTLGSSSTGIENTAIGSEAGMNLTGNKNILLGYSAASNLTAGNNNIIIGYKVNTPAANSSNTLNIGNLIFGTGINGTGNTLSSGNVGIGTTSPAAKLDVVGSIRGNSGLTITTGAVSLPSGQIDNAELANSSLTVTPGTGLTGGGAVSLGGLTTVSAVTTGQGISMQGNFGQWQAHNTYTDLNVNPAYWGWNYVQGNANAPNSNSAQWYRNVVSLGSEYPMRGAGSYSLELAFPRANQAAAGAWMRAIENGAIGGWTQIGFTNPMTAAGDLIYRNAGGTTRLGIGTAGQVLTVSGGVPVWASAAACPTCIINNGNSFGALATMGTNDNQALAFETNNIEQMRITNAGNVGIGTTAPTAKLDVAGDLRLQAQGDLRLSDADSSNFVALQAPSTVGTNVTWTLPAMDGRTGQVLTTNGSGELSFMSNLYLRDNGNVGVNTLSSPTTKFSIGGIADIFQTGFSAQLSNAPGGLTGNFDFRVRISGSVLSNTPGYAIRLRLRNGGFSNTFKDVYVGLASPGDTFDFASTPTKLTFNGGNSSANVGAFGTATTDGIEFFVPSGAEIVISYHSNTTNINQLWQAAGFTSGWKSTSGESSVIDVSGYSIAPTDSGIELIEIGTSNSEIFNVLTNGNVGIGSTSPAAKLDIAGDLRLQAQGDLRLSDADSSNFVALQAPSTVASDVTLTLPATAGTNGQTLSTNGSGVLSWATPLFVTGVTGTDFNIASSGNAHTFNIPSASATARGLIATDAQTFAGNKTFSGSLSASSTLGVSGAATFNNLVTVNRDGSSVLVKAVTAGKGSYLDFQNSDNSVRGLFGVDGVGFTGAAGQFSIAAWTNHPLVFLTNAAERMRITNDGNVGIGTTNPAAKLHIVRNDPSGIQSTAIISSRNGSVSGWNFGDWSGGLATWDIAAHDVYTHLLWWESDLNKKKDIVSLDDGMLEKIADLRSVSFLWKDESSNNANETKTIGFIAQEVNNVFPNLVSGEEGNMSINYSGFIPILTKSVQELDQRVDTLAATAPDMAKSVFSDMELTSKSYQSLEEKVARLDSQVADLMADKTLETPDADQLAQLIIEKIKNENALETNELLEVRIDGLDLKLGTLFSLEKNGALSFDNDIIFRGRLTYEDKDMAGYAKIKKGGKEVKAVYEKPYEFEPVVTATALDKEIMFIVRERSKEGFTIEISDKAEESILFSWHAILVKEPFTAENEMAPSSTPEPTITSASESTSSAQPGFSVTQSPIPEEYVPNGVDIE